MTNAEEWKRAFLAAGHSFVQDEDGEIDTFVHDTPGHNGPGCSICGWSCCWHCQHEPEAIPACGGVKMKIEKKLKAAERYETWARELRAEAEDLRTNQ